MTTLSKQVSEKQMVRHLNSRLRCLHRSWMLSSCSRQVNWVSQVRMEKSCSRISRGIPLCCSKLTCQYKKLANKRKISALRAAPHINLIFQNQEIRLIIYEHSQCMSWAGPKSRYSTYYQQGITLYCPINLSHKPTWSLLIRRWTQQGITKSNWEKMLKWIWVTL